MVTRDQFRGKLSNDTKLGDVSYYEGRSGLAEDLAMMKHWTTSNGMKFSRTVPLSGLEQEKTSVQLRSSDTGTGFLKGWLMPVSVSSQEAFWTMPSITCFNFWLSLKRSSSWVLWSF